MRKTIARWDANGTEVTLTQDGKSFCYHGAGRTGCLSTTTAEDSISYMESYLVRGATRLPLYVMNI